mmetsp:Transcript_429/g.1011  ORF Transcript_429/g.1011 Transcript_429/m.1011 type:complete len:200 (+) Transcript_429:268-867(+)
MWLKQAAWSHMYGSRTSCKTAQLPLQLERSAAWATSQQNPSVHGHRSSLAAVTCTSRVAALASHRPPRMNGSAARPDHRRLSWVALLLLDTEAVAPGPCSVWSLWQRGLAAHARPPRCTLQIRTASLLARMASGDQGARCGACPPPLGLEGQVDGVLSFAHHPPQQTCQTSRLPEPGSLRMNPPFPAAPCGDSTIRSSA